MSWQEVFKRQQCVTSIRSAIRLNEARQEYPQTLRPLGSGSASASNAVSISGRMIRRPPQRPFLPFTASLSPSPSRTAAPEVLDVRFAKPHRPPPPAGNGNQLVACGVEPHDRGRRETPRKNNV